jgi:hypothetical protein
MIRELWEKLRSLFDDDGGASEPMPEEWATAEPLENAEELRPGRDIQAGQIGMFS